MVDTALVPAIKQAVRTNELGPASPYQLSYARRGGSGASFGACQGDTNTNQTARNTLTAVLQAAGADSATIDRIMGLVTQPCPNGNPLSAADAALANAALSSATGRPLVDQMDEGLLQTVLDALDSCIATAAGRNLTIDPTALLYIALWVNMTGAPTTLRQWLAGTSVHGVAAPAPPTVRVDDIEAYLQATAFFAANPRNFQHLQQSVAAGIPLLPGAGV
jgi:hypothetical protein